MKKGVNLYSYFKPLLLILILLSGILIGRTFMAPKNLTTEQETKGNIYSSFIGEIYDKVKENYWESLSDAQLLELFRTSLAKNLTTDIVSITSKEKLLNELDFNLEGKDEASKKEVVVNIASGVLSSLSPNGRSGLYNQKLETQLKNTVENINPEKDLYKDLGLAKNASPEAVEKSYKEQADQLKKQNTPESIEKLKALTYAKEVLTDKDQKTRYDQKGVEPTIFTKLVTSDIGYLQFKKFSPTSFEEFQKGLLFFDGPNGPTSLILDLRGNIGGAIDALPYFLGLFVGRNQYVFDFYHQGEYKPFKSVTDKLPVVDRFRQVVILIDNQTQSSAEVMAASLKKYNKGILVGVPSKGWGTVERIFPLDNQITKDEKYSLFLVHSITLREDNQPIEGRGVEPTVNIKDFNWETKLESYVRYPQLVNEVKQILSQTSI